MPDPDLRQPDVWFDRILEDFGCSRRVIAHCHTVRKLALSYGDSSGIADCDLINGAALLHDVGRGVTHSLSHAQEGADHCREIGLSEPVARIVERHTGAGLSADECTLLRLLPRSCIPVTMEEKIVADADNLVKGKSEISITGRLESALSLNRKVKRRIYRLWLEVEQFRRP
jgi:uncharacterized protein